MVVERRIDGWINAKKSGDHIEYTKEHGKEQKGYHDIAAAEGIDVGR